jgi:hypothetical protein
VATPSTSQASNKHRQRRRHAASALLVMCSTDAQHNHLTRRVGSRPETTTGKTCRLDICGVAPATSQELGKKGIQAFRREAENNAHGTIPVLEGLFRAETANQRSRRGVVCNRSGRTLVKRKYSHIISAVLNFQLSLLIPLHEAIQRMTADEFQSRSCLPES